MEENNNNNNNNQFTQNLIQQFTNLLKSSHNFPDFIIKTDSYQFPSHKSILSFRSPYFTNFFKENESNEISFFEFNNQTISNILLYIYSSQIQFNDQDLLQFFKASILFQLDLLSNFLENQIIQKINEENVFQILSDNKSINSLKLNDSCLEFIEQNFENLIKKSEFLHLSQQQIIQIISNKSKNQENIGIEFFDVLHKYLNQRIQNVDEKIKNQKLKQLFNQFLSKINIDIFKKEDFKKIQELEYLPTHFLFQISKKESDKVDEMKKLQEKLENEKKIEIEKLENEKKIEIEKVENEKKIFQEKLENEKKIEIENEKKKFSVIQKISGMEIKDEDIDFFYKFFQDLDSILKQQDTIEITNTQEMNGEINCNNLIIRNGGVLTVKAWDGNSGGVLKIKAKSMIIIEKGGKIDLSGKGYRGGDAVPQCTNGKAKQGESFNGRGGDLQDANKGGGGAGLGCSSFGSIGGGGGGYGTKGEDSEPNRWQGGNHPGGKGGEIYGDEKITQLYLGSGGGSGHPYSNGQTKGKGGNGGGALLLEANTIINNGEIYCNGEKGEDGINGTFGSGGGGGSGGSILFISKLIFNNGTIEAKGGEKGIGYPLSSHPGINSSGGKGGNGRIAVCGVAKGLTPNPNWFIYQN
ncbi:hypothetical protein M0811_07871 [Anaeramoeba ignava]|uniref:BTB domain-containing protein n=1 Tax=Anaeramoeba ignava TaxID=1746090 RepID=A0A9Q0LNU7_ANAIG|nr:hypothetical protein M0811_07871 [Anaeramoeba ignava]